MIVILVFIFQQNSSVCFIASILTERRAIFHLCVVFTESVPVMSVELMNFHDYYLGFLIHSSIIQLPLSHLCCKMALLSLTRGPFIIFAGVFEMS